MTRTSFFALALLLASAAPVLADELPECPPGQTLTRNDKQLDERGRPTFSCEARRAADKDQDPPANYEVRIDPYANSGATTAPTTPPTPAPPPPPPTSTPNQAPRQPAEAAKTSACAIQPHETAALAPLALLAGLLFWRRRATQGDPR